MPKKIHEVRTVLCVTFKDICRGPMMVVLVKKFFQDRGFDVLVESAGVFANGSDKAPNQQVISTVNQQLGTDVSAHRSRSIGKILTIDGGLDRFDLIIGTDREKRQNLLQYELKNDVLILNEEHGGVSSADFLDDSNHYLECYLALLGGIEEALKEYFQER